MKPIHINKSALVTLPPAAPITILSELALRNERALKAWEIRRLCRMHCLDAVSPAWRKHLDRWFRRERGRAHRWLIKRRCHQVVVYVLEDRPTFAALDERVFP